MFRLVGSTSLSPCFSGFEFVLLGCLVNIPWFIGVQTLWNYTICFGFDPIWRINFVITILSSPSYQQYTRCDALFFAGVDCGVTFVSLLLGHALPFS